MSSINLMERLLQKERIEFSFSMFKANETLNEKTGLKFRYLTFFLSEPIARVVSRSTLSDDKGNTVHPVKDEVTEVNCDINFVVEDRGEDFEPKEERFKLRDGWILNDDDTGSYDSRELFWNISESERVWLTNRTSAEASSEFRRTKKIERFTRYRSALEQK